MFKHSRLTEYFAEPLIVGISTQTDLLLFIALKILNMSGVETHLMLLKVNLKQINLSVRFPCTLSFQLKACIPWIMKKEKVHKAEAAMNFNTEPVNLTKH